MSEKNTARTSGMGGQDDPDYCCEEHFPSQAMTVAEQLEHVCPSCSWSLDSGDPTSDR